MKVGAVEFSAAQFAAIADMLPEPYRGATNSATREQFAERIAKVMVLAEEARRRKLDEKPEFKLQSAYRSEELLADYAQAAIDGAIKIDDAALREYYEAHKSGYERLHVRHILIRIENSPMPLKPGAKDLTGAEALAKAQALLRRIKAGEDFGKIAAAESDDASSTTNFGDLGWFSRGQLAPSFEEAAFRLKTGETSEPVATGYGYHILQVLGREFKPFDEVKADIEKKIRPQLVQKALDGLQEKVPVDYNPAFFGPAKQ